MSAISIHSIPWWHFSERQAALDDVTRALERFNETLDRSIAALPRVSAEDLEREIAEARADVSDSPTWGPF